MDESTTEDSSTSLPDNVMKEEDSGAGTTMLEENVHPLGISCTDGESETFVVKQEIIETFDTKIEPIEDSDVTGEKKPSTNIPKDEDEQDIKQEIVWVEEMRYENDDEASAQIGGHFLDGGESSKADGFNFRGWSSSSRFEYDNGFEDCYMENEDESIRQKHFVGEQKSKNSERNSKRKVGKKLISNKKFNSGTCSDKVNEVDLSKHMKTQKNPTKSCTRCNFETANEADFTKHAMTHFSTKLKTNHCTFCGFKTTEESDLLKHIMTTHMKNQMKRPVTHTCTECNFETTRQRDLQTHMRKEHPDFNPVKYCACCRYKTLNESDLIRHMKIHKDHPGGGPNVCDVCGYIARGPADLGQHKRKHNGDKPYACAQCEFRTARPERLRSHTRIHTGEKPFACDQCGYRSAHRSCFRKHQRMHAGETPYACEQCPYKSISKFNLRTHMRTHSGEKPFACSQCEYRASHNVSLKAHIEKVHS